MNADRKAEWVAALRSGEYEQGKGRLATFSSYPGRSIRYCCLGVACDLAVKAGVEIGIESEWGTIAYDHHETSLPPSVRDWLGVDSNDPPVNSSGGNSLSNLNDSGFPFVEIADIIEEQL